MVRELLSSDSSDSEDDGAEVAPTAGLKVNQEYARRFEHNKKREELARCTAFHTSSDKKSHVC